MFHNTDWTQWCCGHAAEVVEINQEPDKAWRYEDCDAGNVAMGVDTWDPQHQRFPSHSSDLEPSLVARVF